jgi:hypothetical protein
MSWKAIHWSVNVFFWIALALVLASAFYNRGSARVRSSARIEFAPGWIGVAAWMYVAIRMCFIGVAYLRHGLRAPLAFAIGILLLLLSVEMIFVLPGTVVATDAGLVQVFWLWRNKRIRWDKIVEINSERKGSAVTVIGADRTKITHSRRLPDRPRFLVEVKRHCAEVLPPDFPGADASNIALSE